MAEPAAPSATWGTPRRRDPKRCAPTTAAGTSAPVAPAGLDPDAELERLLARREARTPSDRREGST